MERLNKINNLLGIKLSNISQIKEANEEEIIKFNTLLINTEIRILKYFIENRIMKFKDFTDFKKLLSNMIRINIKYTDFDIKVKTI